MSNRFYIGCDLGQSNDPTAIAVVQRVGDRFNCGHLERAPLGTPYPMIVARVAGLMQHPTVAGNCELAIDATGVGRPVADMFKAAGIPFTDVIITAGQSETIGGDDNYRGVPKITLISHVQALLHAGNLKIRKDLPEADTLVRELQDFKVNYSATGYMSFNAREGKHDDLVLALSIAIWAALRTKTGQESWDDFLRHPERWDYAGGMGATSPDPDFGYAFAAEPLQLIHVPAGQEGTLAGIVSLMRVGDHNVATMKKADAIARLQDPLWSKVNADLCNELGLEVAP